MGEERQVVSTAEEVEYLEVVPVEEVFLLFLDEFPKDSFRRLLPHSLLELVLREENLADPGVLTELVPVLLLVVVHQVPVSGRKTFGLLQLLVQSQQVHDTLVPQHLLLNSNFVLQAVLAQKLFFVFLTHKIDVRCYLHFVEEHLLGDLVAMELDEFLHSRVEF